MKIRPLGHVGKTNQPLPGFVLMESWGVEARPERPANMEKTILFLVFICNDKQKIMTIYISIFPVILGQTNGDRFLNQKVGC